MLEINKVTKIYDNNVTAISNIDFMAEKGILNIIGPTAAGKTTLIKIITGLETPTFGEIIFNSNKLAESTKHNLKKIGYMPQIFDFYKNISAEALLDYIAVLRGFNSGIQRKSLVEEVVEAVHLNDFRHIPIGEYSFGMKRRLGIAQALLGNPEYIILDEPFHGLDPVERTRVISLLVRIANKRLVIVSSNSLEDVAYCASMLLVLCNGSMVYQGTGEQLKKRIEGKVWILDMDDFSLEEIRLKYRVVGVQQINGKLAAKILSSTKPFEQAYLCDVRLEDGYLALMDIGVRND
ncbi:ATP-binding cassette domain-containing protein [Dendrosporobacter sp. 1207_IL3150]|uniref:ATP-binding cassette domain-containing protein n=1 Tax=Dendrosporobacter sp. 1207_IL3150 TaxID=3084054 RepID=UPI002FDB7439